MSKKVEKMVAIGDIKMEPFETKPLPSGLWKSNKNFRNKNHDPQNVSNYRLRKVPDGCWNCYHRYSGIVDLVGMPILSCALTRHRPDSLWYESVDEFGICDSYKREKDGGNKSIKIIIQ